MNIDILCCLIAAFCLVGVTATSTKNLPIWKNYNIPEDRANILNSLYDQYDGNDKILRDLMRQAYGSESMSAEYSALADFMIKNNLEYSSLAVILAGNVGDYELKRGEDYQNLAYILRQFPDAIQNFPVNMIELLINAKYEKYLIKPSDNDVLVAKASDYINFNQDTIGWQITFDDVTGSYRIQRDGVKWYATDAGAVQLVPEDSPSDGNDQWHFIPEQVPNATDDSNHSSSLRYRIKNELRNECVCQLDDTPEIGNLLLRPCETDNCVWVFDGSRTYFSDGTQDAGKDFFDLL